MWLTGETLIVCGCWLAVDEEEDGDSILKPELEPITPDKSCACLRTSAFAPADSSTPSNGCIGGGGGKSGDEEEDEDEENDEPSSASWDWANDAWERASRIEDDWTAAPGVGAPTMAISWTFCALVNSITYKHRLKEKGKNKKG